MNYSCPICLVFYSSFDETTCRLKSKQSNLWWRLLFTKNCFQLNISIFHQLDKRYPLFVFTRQSIVPFMVIINYWQVVFKMPPWFKKFNKMKKMGQKENSTDGSETESCCWAGLIDNIHSLKAQYCPLCLARLRCCFVFHGSEASIVSISILAANKRTLRIINITKDGRQEIAACSS